METTEKLSISRDSLKELCDLMQLDLDAIEAYEQALKQIKTLEINKKISSFKRDHIQHVEDLSKIIKRCGGEPPKREKDFKGFIIKGMTALQSVLGEKAALHAMKTNEKLTNSKYDKALNFIFPDEAKKLVEKNYKDEKRHLAYIEEVLNQE